ncbi:MAG: hypothetical protein D4S01_07335 [Dehalococcoidia bacterium]|nr:MAG: hypothetical protein D4S01_07335 [Dehalococcoidia bacterium]
MKITKFFVLILAIIIIYSGSLFAAGAIFNDAEDFFTSYDPSQTSDYIYNESDASGDDDLTTWGNIYSKTYTAATTIDDIIMVTEHLEYLRVGLIVVGDSTDDVTIKGNFGIPKALL